MLQFLNPIINEDYSVKFLGHNFPSLQKNDVALLSVAFFIVHAIPVAFSKAEECLERTIKNLNQKVHMGASTNILVKLVKAIEKLLLTSLYTTLKAGRFVYENTAIFWVVKTAILFTSEFLLLHSIQRLYFDPK